MSFDPRQFRALLHAWLDPVGLGGDAAVELLMLTAATESELGRYLVQLGGPALGAFQMEPATHLDIWRNYLRFSPGQRDLASAWCCADPVPDRMTWDLRYAALMARFQYRRWPEPLPDPTDVAAMAELYKLRFNTPLGAATVDGAAEAYRRFCQPTLNFQGADHAQDS